MSLTSTTYAVFLAVAVVAYGVTVSRHRGLVLLLASYLFYAQFATALVTLMLFVTIVGFFGARLLVQNPSTTVLGGLVLLTLLPLILGKSVIASSFIGFDGPFTAGVLSSGVAPLGLSFYTLQVVGYLIDVARGTVVAERSIASFGLFVAFFPQVLAGPIARASRLLPQVNTLRPISFENVYLGSKQILWGAFCKVVVADNLAAVVNTALDEPLNESGGSLALAFVLFSFQLYFDFQGYSNMAIGAARLFGVRLDVNFDRPYLAASLREFWRRWHISLSTWFRDYVYVPLGGNQRAGVGWVTAIVVVFLLSGLWHGVAASFLLWGLIHAAGYVSESAARRSHLLASFGRRYRALRMVTTFLFVALAWVAFRIDDLASIGEIYLRSFAVAQGAGYFSLNPVFWSSQMVLSVAALGSALYLEVPQRLHTLLHSTPSRPKPVAAELVFVNWCAVSVIFVGQQGAGNFAYFRF